MATDIRYPIGLFFTVLGILLMAWGAWSDPALYAKSLGHNVNFGWGAVLLAFGMVTLALAGRARRG